MTTTIRSSADGSKSYIAVGGTDRVTIGSQGIEAGSYKPGSIVDTDLTLSANSAPVKAALNAGGDAPIYACRAWVKFNGTGTPAINGSGNVSSITDNGTGLYTINFITAMPDINYSPSITCKRDVTGIIVGSYRVTPSFATSSLLIETTRVTSAAAPADSEDVTVNIIR